MGCSRCRRFRRGARRLASLLNWCTRGETIDHEPTATAHGSCQVYRGSVGVYDSHSSFSSTTASSLSDQRDIDGLSDVNDSDMADDLPVTCSDESKVLTSDDTSLDQAEGEDTLSSSAMLLCATPFVCEESELPEPMRAQHVIITASESVGTEGVIADQDGQEDCAILQSVLTGGHYEMIDEDRAALQTVISSLSVDDPTSPMTHDSSDYDSQDRAILHSTLSDVHKEMVDEDSAALQSVVGLSDSFLSTSMTNNDENKDAHDCEILRLILNDGNYEISPDDSAALETVIDTFTVLPQDSTTATNLSQLDGVANTGEDKSCGTVLATEFNDECSQDCAILHMLTDSHYEITDEDHAALQTAINILSTGSGVCDINEMTYDYVTDMDSFDRDILQLILDDGNYNISSDDRAALQSCIFDFYPTTN